METHLITNGETIEITKSCSYIIHQCCKCGIRHKWEFIWTKQGVDIKITEEPLTSQSSRPDGDWRCQKCGEIIDELPCPNCWHSEVSGG